MKLKSNFLTGLDFQPLVLWSDAVPALALGSELICGFHFDSLHPVFEHPDKGRNSNASLLKSIYPTLTLPELARLIKSAAFSKYFEISSLLKIYGFHSSSDLMEILELLPKTSSEFQTFVSIKKIGPQELAPLTNLTSDQLSFVTHILQKSNESKQDTLKRLELLSDLIQMGHKLTEIDSLSLTNLYKKRYPVTTTRDQNLESRKFPWLSQVKNSFKRRGDKAGFEINFFAGSPAELKKVSQNLIVVAETWDNKL